MSDDNDWTSGKTQQGVTIPRPRKSGSAYEDTLPGTPPSRSLPRAPDIMTSAPVATVTATAQTSGSVSLGGERIVEPLAREIIVRRMSKRGIALQSDYAFSHDDLLLRLDGYDPAKKVGYQYISHAGADVVTDFDYTAEQRLAQLGAQGIVHILVIHDHQAPDTDEVLRRVQVFLDQFTF
ncbi:MAG: hypothetical protein GY811_02015 [Myxococcales bacterium]|nr:hypothetical protein [Myxococcales bacterium]